LNKVYIIYKDGVYDITKYLDNHPGGKQILLKANCKIVDVAFDKYHYPLGSAPAQMKKMKIGEVRHELSTQARV
jgi:cytochrome b involved in lipid metabolism